MAGIRLDGVIERVTDGDTLRITADDRLFKVRVLGLDTEESNANPHKPVTRWGQEATAFTKSILPEGTPVEIEFPGSAPVIVDGEINTRYLDNFERPLGFVHLRQAVEGFTDFSELMIRKGFSPYFVKYGRAVFADHDRRYSHAEWAAQQDDVGVWNQFDANGVMSEALAPRNYAQLMVWWELRARIIDGFRQAKAAAPDAELYNTRLDYATLLEKAAGETVTVFMELRGGETVGELHHVIRSGSNAQPFQLFLPLEDRPEIVEVKRLLSNRYIADGEDFPRRNYAYITGPCKLFNNRPEMVVERVDQISDMPPDADTA
ncbi:MAG: thermonuclease family protein [Geminicoccaceae bacterium]